MFLTIIVSLVSLSTLIIVHELGHFIVAKKSGIKVEEFGLGYPPRVWGKRIGETIYSINWIPFGGFVRLFGQEKIDKSKKEGAFWAQSKKVRLAVISAGVIANIVLAWLLFSIVYLIVGIPVKTNQVFIEAVVPGSPAQEADIQSEDVVVSIDGQQISSVDQFIKITEDKKGEEIDLVVKRNGQQKNVPVVPRSDTPEGEGPLGVVISSFQLKHYPFWKMPFYSFFEGAKETWAWIMLIFTKLGEMIRDLISAGEVPSDIAGPIGIFQVSSQVARAGITAVLQFIAILSVNLGVINIFPFPALDGGHFLFLLIEGVTGRRSKKQVERWINAFGMAFLLFLMLLVTINDIRRILETTQFGMRVRQAWPF